MDEKNKIIFLLQIKAKTFYDLVSTFVMHEINIPCQAGQFYRWILTFYLDKEIDFHISLRQKDTKTGSLSIHQLYSKEFDYL